MNLGEIEPLIVTTDSGEQVDLTPLLQHLQAMTLSAMQSREHYDGGGFLGVSKDTVRGVKMGMQLAVDALYGPAVGKAFEFRVNPELRDLESPVDERPLRRNAMNRKPTYRERLVLGAVGLLALYAVAWLALSGTADRVNAWLIGLWPL